MELRLVALGNSAMKVFTNRPTGYLQVYKATLTTAISLTIKNNGKYVIRHFEFIQMYDVRLSFLKLFP